MTMMHKWVFGVSHSFQITCACRSDVKLHVAVRQGESDIPSIDLLVSHMSDVYHRSTDVHAAAYGRQTSYILIQSLATMNDHATLTSKEFRNAYNACTVELLFGLACSTVLWRKPSLCLLVFPVIGVALSMRLIYCPVVIKHGSGKIWKNHV